jgi:hypothetical protein
MHHGGAWFGADSARDPAETHQGAFHVRYHALPAALALLVCTAAPALAASRFTLTLDPVAYDNSTRDIVLGEGRVDATLDGASLTLSGHFTGLSSPATAVKLGIGLDFGVPAGEFFTTLVPTNGAAGSIGGTVTLTPAQVAALNAKRLFLRLDTVRGSDGALWGWFEPAKAVSTKGGK